RDRELAAAQLELAEQRKRLPHRERGVVRDRAAAEVDRVRLGLEPPPATLAARRRVRGRLDPRLLLAALRLVEPRELDAGAVTPWAPPVARVVRKEPRIERLEAPRTLRTRPLGRVQLRLGRCQA